MSGQGCVYKRCGCLDPVTGRQLEGGARAWRAAVTEAGTSAWSWPPGLMAGAGGSGAGYPSLAAAAETLAALRSGQQLLVELTEFDRPHRLGSRTTSSMMHTSGALTLPPSAAMARS